MFLVLFIFGFVAFFTVVGFLVTISDYFYNRYSFTPKISFNTFRDWYSLNPDRYKLNEHSISIITNNGIEEIQFSSYFDWRKHTKLLKNMGKNDTKLQKDESLLKILNAVQSDINAVRIMAEKEINEAKTYLNN